MKEIFWPISWAGRIFKQ